MFDLLSNFFSSYGFHPHGMCYLWEPALLWLHGASDTLIGLAYLSISATLAYLVRKVKVPFHFMFLAFGIFIGACGMTHFIEVYTLYIPVYWLSGAVKVITAIASITTAILLFPLLPKATDLVNNARLAEDRRLQLETTHQELATLYQKVMEMDQLKTQFFANISHELRTPLTLIMGPTKRLLSTDPLTNSQRKDLELIQRNTSILLKHVNDLLDVAKLEAGKIDLNYAEVDLARLVRLTASHFDAIAQDQQISYTVEAHGPLYLQADPEKLQRILLNLLSNAFKFTPSKGSIACSLRTEGEQAVIEVRDSGPGIPDDMREAIFERFRQVDSGSTRRFGGTGLGLSIVKEFVELHGGAVQVSNTKGGGATFAVKIPLLQKAPHKDLKRMDSTVSIDIAKQTTEELKAIHTNVSKQDSILAQEEDFQSSYTDQSPLILIIEDNKEMNRFIAETLATKYRVVTAFDGQEGLEKAFSVNPDLILCDVMMPRISGDQLVRQIRNTTYLDDIPIIMLTAKADDELRVRLLQEGAQDYLMKPFLPDELLIRVDNLIEIREAREVLQQALSSGREDIAELAGEIARRKQELQEALSRVKESEERARLIVEDVKDYAIYGLDPNGYVTSWNAGAERIKGYTSQEIIGQHFSVFYTAEDIKSGKPQQHLNIAATQGKLEDEGWRVRKDGSRFFANVIITALRDEHGRLRGFSKVSRDITEQKQVEEEKANLLTKERAARSLAEEASRAKDEFLATVSHELRTPLTAILGWSRMLSAGVLDQNNMTKAVETIERNAHLQAKIVEDILDVSRIITGKLRIEPSQQYLIPIIESAIEVIRPSAEAKNIKMDVFLDPNVGPIWGDPTRLQQIAWNLLSNAIKFTPSGGSVTVKLQQVEQTAQFTVSDTGEGIPTEFLPYVFDRFRQANSKITRTHGGLGLGLALVRHLVELHGGKVSAESIGPNKGAIFTISFPLLNQAEISKAGSTSQEASTTSSTNRGEEEFVPSLNHIRILLVEDEPDSRDMFTTLLKKCGAEVQAASTAGEALEIIKSSDLDVLVSDIGLPGQDGYELITNVRNLLSEKSQIPAIALTAYARSEDRNQALSAGYQIHLAKPVNPADIAFAIISVMKQSRYKTH